MLRRLTPWLALTAIAVVIVAVIVVRGASQAPSQRGPSRIAGAVDLAPPAAISEEERTAATVGLDPQPTVKLEAGAWVEVADPESGRLAQRYSAAQVEPLPQRHLQMTTPRASFHAASGRVITLEADRATAHVPRRALQSGLMEGNVVIRLFQPDPQGQVALDRDTPALEVHTSEAAFDAEVGQLRCDNEVEVVTPAVRFRGRNLTIVLDDSGEAPERVVVEQLLEPLQVDLVLLEAESQARPSRGGAPEPVAATGRAPSAGQAPAATAPAASPSTGELTAGQRQRSGAAASGPASPQAATAEPASAAGPRFHRLTFHDDVRVVRTRQGVQSTVEGDTLALIFSLESEDATFAWRRLPQRGGRWLEADTWSEFVATAPRPADASPVTALMTTLLAAAPPIEDRLTITCTGRLVMLPDPEAAKELSSPDDVRIEVAVKRPGGRDGMPSSDDARRVRFADPQQDLRGHCDFLRYDTRPKRLALRGTADAPAEVHTQRFSVVAPHLNVVAGGGDGSLGGPGRITIREPSGQAGAAVSPVHLCAAGGGEVLDAALLSAIAATLSQQAKDAAGPRIPLEILWEDGVDLTFAPPEGGEETGALRTAAFRGDVRVVGEDFAMRSDRLTVGFSGGGGVEESISSIDALGLVQVRRLGETASMDADELAMTLERLNGRTAPKTLTAKGGVAARDAQRTILSESLDVTFKPKAGPDQANAAAPPPRREGTSLGEQIGTVEIASVLAQRAVRVELEDGSRVYADRLEGNSIAGTLRLLADAGSDVLIVSDKVVADRMKELRFDENARTATSEGPGRFRFFEEPVPMPELRAPQRPTVGRRPALEAEWSQTFLFEERGGARREGAITLTGDVNVRSEPTMGDAAGRELDTLTARSLVLGLIATPGGGAGGGGGGGGEGGGGEGGGGGEAAATSPRGAADGLLQRAAGGGESSRDLASLRASGDAELQSRRWADANRSGLPQQVFRVRGDVLEYDLRTREARVPSGGDLLVHDVSPSTAELRDAASTFGSRGTSNFSWKGSMEMKREAGDRYLISLVNDVEVLHGGLRAIDELALTCDRLEITIDRPDPQATRGDAPGGRAAPTRRATGSLDLGGDAKLVRIRAVGGVLVQSKSDVEQVSCHEFDYNVATGIATMRARTGEQVQAIVKGGFAPLRAAAMRWDMREGRIQIMGAGSEVGR